MPGPSSNITLRGCSPPTQHLFAMRMFSEVRICLVDPILSISFAYAWIPYERNEKLRGMEEFGNFVYLVLAQCIVF